MNVAMSANVVGLLRCPPGSEAWALADCVRQYADRWQRRRSLAAQCVERTSITVAMTPNQIRPSLRLSKGLRFRDRPSGDRSQPPGMHQE